ncbi:MAG: hypothetical protein M5U14_05995 [Acidimicrobiia bacterium]|nr:hypothetical protein [Acidimicrobiia bacterium]
MARLEQRVRKRSQTLARQLDRVLRVLEAWGYVEDWQLTEAGTLLTRLYTEVDLLVAETLRTGVLDGLEPPEIVAIVSCFTYERRGPEGARPAAPRWPSASLARRYRDVERIWRDLSLDEDDAGLPETRPPDPGFALLAHTWATGGDLSTILEDEELTGGDFVRIVKQTIDLLRQIADVAPDPATAASAAEGAGRCFRGVVAASSAVPG